MAKRVPLSPEEQIRRERAVRPIVEQNWELEGKRRTWYPTVLESVFDPTPMYIHESSASRKAAQRLKEDWFKRETERELRKLDRLEKSAIKEQERIATHRTVSVSRNPFRRRRARRGI